MVLLFFLLTLQVQSKTVVFNPVASTNARTIRQFNLALGRSGLGNMNTSFLASSLNFGILERLEIGTAPVFYVDSNHRYNYSVKWNFYRGENFDWSLFFGKSKYEIQLETSDAPENVPMEMDADQLAVNYHPPGSRWAFGASGTNSCGQLRSKNPWVRHYSFKCVNEHGLDAQYETMANQWISVGHAKMREAGFTPWEEIQNGAGIAYTWFRKAKLFSRPSIGIYKPWGHQPLYLFTTTFYEGD